MKPATTHQHESAALADSPSMAFLDALREEQHRFLDSVRAAGADVRDEPGHLALMAAIQTRLAQQLFDAQRAFLKRQVAIDAEVARIDAGADAAAAVRVRAGSNTVGSGDVTLFPAPVALSHDTNRIGVVAAGTDTLHGNDEPHGNDELDGVRDDAFEPVEIDPMLPQRELAQLLEQWWNRINADGEDMVDRARARARLHAHAVAVETAGREFRLPAPEVCPPAATSLPAPDAAMVVTTVPPLDVPAGDSPANPAADRLLPPSDRPSFDPPIVLAIPAVAPAALATPSVLPPPSPVAPAAAMLPAPIVAPSAALAVPAPAALPLPLPADGSSIDLAALLDALSRELSPMLALPAVSTGDDLSIKLERWELLDNSAVLDRLSALEPAPRSRRRRRSASGTSAPLPRSLGAAVGPAAADDHRDPFDHVVVRTIVPMAAVTAVITLIMALVG